MMLHPEVPDRISRSRLANEKTLQIKKSARMYSMSFLTTGIFAAVGALYRWGDGPLFSAAPGTDLELYIAELVVAAPAAILASVGMSRLRRWGMLLVLFTTGVLIYGSILVYASILSTGFPFPLELCIPPVFGIGLCITTIKWV
ncbi:MAG: hypothetical protein GYA24_16735 [Candidatus Lokiarchaeota archaeon]|nr:hypothetical protein [Candidatus Lokiarchaeota archaeon]